MYLCIIYVCSTCRRLYILTYLCVFPVSAPVNSTTAILDTPNENRTLHSITFTCTINPDSTADMCEVRATASGHTLTGNGICAYVLVHNFYLHMHMCI